MKKSIIILSLIIKSLTANADVIFFPYQYTVFCYSAEFIYSYEQVRDLGLENSKDSFLWNYAKKNNYCIVTFDGDFYDLGLIKGSSPKVKTITI